MSPHKLIAIWRTQYGGIILRVDPTGLGCEYETVGMYGHRQSLSELMWSTEQESYDYVKNTYKLQIVETLFQAAR
jgi:hypothetical protein